MGKFFARIGDQLTLYAKYLAWLHAVPRPDPRSRRAKSEQEPPKISRFDKLKAGGVDPPMPPNPMPHMIHRLIEIGLVQSGGMGAAPLTWGELAAWSTQTGIQMPTWEARLIRRLSTEYVTMSRKADDESCPPPWRAPVTRREVENETADLRAVLG